jgi:hypothetical protein
MELSVKKEIPNCALCKWKINSLQGVLITTHKCAAQGYKYTFIVYGKRLCKKLFQPREENK